MDKNKTGEVKRNRIIARPFMPYVFALLGVLGFDGILALNSSENIRYSNSIFSFIVFALAAFVLVKIWDDFAGADKPLRLWPCIYSVALSIALHFGARLETAENVRVDRLSLWFGILALSVFFIPIMSVLSGRSITMARFLLYGKNKAEQSDSKPFKFVQIWAIIFLLWIPTFLALYPGAFVYDATEEYLEVITRVFNMHHPLLHVLALGGLVHGAEYIGWTANTGIAIYVIIQMLIMSLIFAYTIKRLELLGAGKIYLTCTMIFYGLFPLFALYSTCTAKDGLFTAFLFLLTVELLIYLRQPEDFNPTVFTLASALMMLMRNNGVYAYVTAMVILLVCEYIRTSGSKKTVVADVLKERGRVNKILILTLLSLVLYVGGGYILKTAVRAEDNEHQEILTVPIQQLARTYTYSKDVFTEEELEALHTYLPEEYLVTYNARISDILKSGFNNQAYARDSATFWKLWKDIGVKKPLIYLNAWFGTSYGYWYPDAINNVYAGNQMYTFRYTDSSYFGFETEPPGVRQSRFPLLERFYENLSLQLFQQKLPVISQLFAPGFVWWLCAFVLMCVLDGGIKSARNALSLLPTVMVWLTVLLGPTVLVRYVLILWFIIPIYSMILCQDR